MRNDQDIQPGHGVLKLDETAVDAPPPPIDPAEKGSLRSMWELLMQLRVLLPYLTRLVPLLDRGLLKAAPDLSEFRKELQDVHTGNRDLGTQIRNQALQMERIEEQLLRVREIGERTQKESSELSVELRSLTGWVRALAALTALVLLALIVVAALQLFHLGR